MPALTPQLLEFFPFTHHADPGTIQRGRAYYKDGRAWNVELITKNKAVILVDGDSGEYTVEIEISQKTGELLFECDCPYAGDGNFCKHMVAAALELKDYLEEENEFDDEGDQDDEGFVHPAPVAQTASQNWQKKLSETLALWPRRSASPNLTRYVAVVLLTRSQIGYYGYRSASGVNYYYSLEPVIIKSSDWYSLAGSEKRSPHEINELLETDKKWIRAGERMYQQFNPAGCLNLTAEAVSFLGVLSELGRMYGIGTSNVSMLLSMLARLDIPVFLGSLYPAKIDRRIHILPDPIDVKIDMQSDENELTLQAGYEQDGSFIHIQKRVETISINPAWVLMDDRVAQLRNANALSILPSLPIKIPTQQVEVFREQYFASIAQLLPIKSDIIQWSDVHAEPIPRLYLRDDQRSSPADKDNILRADLRFGYGEHELPVTKTDEPYRVETDPETWNLIRVHRKPQREYEIIQLLTDPVYRLKRADNRHPIGTYELRARTHPFDFLMHSIPLLTRAGFEIYGEEKLKLGRINRAISTLRVHITSGIDWFDLKTFIAYGDQQISLHDVRKALKRGENYVKLADGSVGQIPAEWLDKYKHLWNLAEETEDGFRVNDFHLPLLDALLEEDATLHAARPPDLIQRREHLRRFERITPQPLPQYFTGELRPYQKHGYDWLHFLREYKFGGILADDMGLGKTVQVLVYLQSLKESRDSPEERNRSASLLVVPKSLITNWQRESEKFTPHLRFLEYLGNFRNKETSIFDDYDVVLTTYGTMLRDIELLRGYTFDHIILDESQAIKNPLAKSAKATRLLHGRHRIVLTGTPVENNTFELWSQFAFLNPGLLGNMDYFRREFANPIESASDEESAALLRKLVFPFILRRTKEQVAPELPPRTERIVYTDMVSAQKKLYIQTREKYRAELLGLIERDGINDVRFRILEGLLRLRQIAVHPALVDRQYKGESPKFEILLETLETLQAENHKALIFSQFVETLKLVKRELDARNIKYVYLDGQTPNRQSRVDLFQNDASYPFFLISLKAGGVGLNLTAADYVVHLDPWWNPAVEMQASDRAHRIGQDKPVFIYKIIARDTVEEKILQLQEKKRALVKSLIATESSFFKSLTKEDVKMLFE
ncbi:MAG TPA: DEAD/DEAH box helicase [Anaerolineales bacterium]|nr:DEAD/DEAH box helicase [Anaerolineales bacterium]